MWENVGKETENRAKRPQDRLVYLSTFHIPSHSL